MSDMKSSLSLTQQLMGIENTNTTRLLHLKSWQADLSNTNADKTWIFQQVFRRKYLQHRVSLQAFKIWNAFQTIPERLTLIAMKNSILTEIPIYPGNWNPNALANYLTNKLQVLDPETGLPDPFLSTVVSWDPYQLKFYFCPNGITLAESDANKILGFPEEGVSSEVVSLNTVVFTAPKCVNLYTNFTMNNIPVSHFLACVPITVPYGEYNIFTNFDNSHASLILDPELNVVRIILKDDRENMLYYPDDLDWEVVLAIEAVSPEGFQPLEA